MTINMDQIVDDILRETDPVSMPVPAPRPTGDTVLFTVPGDLSTFTEAMETIRNWPAEQRAVIFCESIENLLPGKVLNELMPQCRVVRTTGCVPETLLGGVKQVVIPAMSERVAARFVGTSEPGAIPAIWRAAVDAGVPVCGNVSGLTSNNGSDAAACTRAAELAHALVDKGLVDLTTGGTSPELELVGELVHHLCESCEMEDGTECTDCGMCKVRGF